MCVCVVKGLMGIGCIGWHRYSKDHCFVTCFPGLLALRTCVKIGQPCPCNSQHEACSNFVGKTRSTNHKRKKIKYPVKGSSRSGVL